MGQDWTSLSKDEISRAFATIGGTVVNKELEKAPGYDLVMPAIKSLYALMAKAPYGTAAGYGFQVLEICGGKPVTYMIEIAGMMGLPRPDTVLDP